MKILFFGPGWRDGLERLGSLDDIPELEKPIRFYQKKIRTSVFIYCLINFVIVNIVYFSMAALRGALDMNYLVIGIAMIAFTLIQIGRLLDGREAFWSECTRVIIGFGIILKFFHF